jgi:trehalose 2-sulfotransferase
MGAYIRGYAICATPRSGSNFLCQLLASTGALGKPLEYFNVKGRRIHEDPYYPDDPAEQFRRIMTVGATPNGVYGLKLFPEQHDLVSTTYAWTKLLPNLKFIVLERRDILGQALSWVRATQTDRYLSTDSPQRADTYNGEMIRSSLRLVVGRRARWSMFFARTGITPLPVFYEDVVANPQTEVDRIAAFIGDCSPALIRLELVETKIQRDMVSEEWRRRFQAEFGNPDVVDNLGPPGRADARVIGGIRW